MDHQTIVVDFADEMYADDPPTTQQQQKHSGSLNYCMMTLNKSECCFVLESLFKPRWTS